MNRQELYLDRRLLRTKKSLKRALLSQLKYKPYNEITVTDLVKNAKVTRASFYNHYTTKDHLLDTLLLEKNQELIQAYKEPILKHKPFTLNRLSASDVKLFNYIFDNADFYTTILNSDITLVAENQMFDSIRKINIEVLRVKDRVIKTDFIASYLSYAIVGLIKEWVREGYKYDPEFMSEQLLELMRVSPYKTFHIKLSQKKN